MKYLNFFSFTGTCRKPLKIWIENAIILRCGDTNWMLSPVSRAFTVWWWPGCARSRIIWRGSAAGRSRVMISSALRFRRKTVVTFSPNLEKRQSLFRQMQITSFEKSTIYPTFTFSIVECNSNANDLFSNYYLLLIIFNYYLCDLRLKMLYIRLLVYKS